MSSTPYSNSITPANTLFSLRLREIWRYRDLLMLFVRRDFVAKYKQTILGPAWFIIQPLMQMMMFTVVFGNIAGISTDGAPKTLFYLAGITAWTYFANCLKKTSAVFTQNAGLFGKVYFPRAVTPLSIVISNLIEFAIAMMLFLAFFFYYLFAGAAIAPNITLLLFPVLVITMAFMGLGLGMLISAMTTKYRDLQNLVSFGVQLLMYASPVIYPLSTIPEKYRLIIVANPMTGIIETFKYAFLGTGTFNGWYLLYSVAFAAVIFVVGLAVFNKTEKNFMDTV
jgi:lipopolysaccharide transport system permease protein